MSKAVQFDDYGGVEVLEVRDVARPEPGPDQVLVAVRAAGINPSEGKIRAGVVREIFSATFPSGEGSDLAGVVEEVGTDVKDVAVGDEVIGYADNRASHAEYVLVEAANLTAKPAEVPWEVAGALFVAGVTGVATVRAVAPSAGEAVVTGNGRRRSGSATRTTASCFGSVSRPPARSTDTTSASPGRTRSPAGALSSATRSS
jgi:NADPH:quinone reductase-like Zn-dependent oxidoreductase